MGLAKQTIAEKAIQELMKRAVDAYSIGGWGQREKRLPVLSHSSCGKCLKLAAIKYLLAVGYLDFDLPVDTQGNRRMELGTELHLRFAEALRAASTSSMLYIPPFRVHSWGDGIESGLSGTPDDLILDTVANKLYLVDHKTTTSSRFRSRASNSEKFGGADDNHLMQVSAYAASDEVVELASRLKAKVVPAIVYWNLEGLSCWVCKAPAKYAEKAKQWAEMAHNYIMHVVNNNEFLHVDVPTYMCGFCPLFESIEDKVWSTVKERKEAQKIAGETNCLTCQGITSPEELTEVINARTSDNRTEQFT